MCTLDFQSGLLTSHESGVAVGFVSSERRQLGQADMMFAVTSCNNMNLMRAFVRRWDLLIRPEIHFADLWIFDDASIEFRLTCAKCTIRREVRSIGVTATWNKIVYAFLERENYHSLVLSNNDVFFVPDVLRRWRAHFASDASDHLGKYLLGPLTTLKGIGVSKGHLPYQIFHPGFCNGTNQIEIGVLDEGNAWHTNGSEPDTKVFRILRRIDKCLQSARFVSERRAKGVLGFFVGISREVAGSQSPFFNSKEYNLAQEDRLFADPEFAGVVHTQTFVAHLKGSTLGMKLNRKGRNSFRCDDPGTFSNIIKR